MLESPGDSARGTSVGSPVSEFSASAPSPVPGADSPVVLQPDVQARAEGHERPPHKPAAMPNLEPPLVEEPPRPCCNSILHPLWLRSWTCVNICRGSRLMWMGLPRAVHFTQAARTRVVCLGFVSPAWPSLGLLGS